MFLINECQAVEALQRAESAALGLAPADHVTFIIRLLYGYRIDRQFANLIIIIIY